MRGLVDDPQGATVAFENARHLIGIERALGLFVEPSVQAWAQSKPAIIDSASWMYLNAQTTVTRRRAGLPLPVPQQSFYFLRNMFMVAMGIALIGYIVYPTAPPRFFPEWGFFDAVSSFAGVDHTARSTRCSTPTPRCPSMHVCFSLMIGVPLSRLVNGARRASFWALYPLLVTFVDRRDGQPLPVRRRPRRRHRRDRRLRRPVARPCPARGVGLRAGAAPARRGRAARGPPRTRSESAPHRAVGFWNNL